MNGAKHVLEQTTLTIYKNIPKVETEIINGHVGHGLDSRVRRGRSMATEEGVGHRITVWSPLLEGLSHTSFHQPREGSPATRYDHFPT